MGQLAGEKHCDCKSCEAGSSDDDSGNDVGDRREFLILNVYVIVESVNIPNYCGFKISWLIKETVK